MKKKRRKRKMMKKECIRMTFISDMTWLKIFTKFHATNKISRERRNKREREMFSKIHRQFMQHRHETLAKNNITLYFTSFKQSSTKKNFQ